MFKFGDLKVTSHDDRMTNRMTTKEHSSRRPRSSAARPIKTYLRTTMTEEGYQICHCYQLRKTSVIKYLLMMFLSDLRVEIKQDYHFIIISLSQLYGTKLIKTHVLINKLINYCLIIKLHSFPIINWDPDPLLALLTCYYK